MKYTSKVTAILLAAGTLINSGAVFAARGDLYTRDGDKIVNPNKVEIEYEDVVGSKKTSRKVSFNAEDYGIEGNDGKIYKMEDVLQIVGKLGEDYFNAFEDYQFIYPEEDQKQKCETLTNNLALVA